MGTAEVGDLFWIPVIESVVAFHDFNNPRIHGESLQLIIAKEQHAVGYFFTNALQETKLRFSFGIGAGDYGPEKVFLLSQLCSGLFDVCSAEAELAIP